METEPTEDKNLVNENEVSEVSIPAKENLSSKLKKIILGKRFPVLIRNWTFTLLVLVMVIILAKLIIRDVNDHSYHIQPFRMPQDFVSEGYDGTTTAYVILDKVNEIIQEGNHTRSIIEIEKYNQNFEQNEVKLEVSGIGISPEAISSYFKRFFGIQTNTISGEFVKEDSKLKLFLRITGEPTQTIAESTDSLGKYGAFKKLIQRGAESILKMNNPTLLALYYGSNEDYDQAFATFRFAIQKNPQMTANIYAWWAEALYFRDNDTTYAMPKIRQALSVDPTNAAAYNIWGNMYKYFGKNYEEQIRVLRKATELDPNCVACWNDLGATLAFESRQGDKKNEAEAITCFEKCYSLDSTYTTSFRHWADLLFLQGKIDEASEKIEKVGYHRFDFNSILYLALCIARNDKPQISITYKNILKNVPVKTVIARLNSGAFRHEQRGNYDIAFKLVRFALEKDSTTSAAALPLSTLAELEVLTGNKEGFYRHIDKALKLGLLNDIDKNDLKEDEPYKSLSNEKRFQELLKKNNILFN